MFSGIVIYFKTSERFFGIASKDEIKGQYKFKFYINQALFYLNMGSPRCNICLFNINNSCV